MMYSETCISWDYRLEKNKQTNKQKQKTKKQQQGGENKD